LLPVPLLGNLLRLHLSHFACAMFAQPGLVQFLRAGLGDVP